MTITPEQGKAWLEVTLAIADAIKAAGPAGIPAGHLYAMVMDRMSLDSFEAILTVLTDGVGHAPLVHRAASQLLTWVGPAPATVAAVEKAGNDEAAELACMESAEDEDDWASAEAD